LLYALTKEQLDIYGRHLQVFTDASKTDNGKIAAAYCIPGLDIEYSCRLPDELTIFSGELTAIKLSLVWIKQNYERFEHRKNVAIFSDSLSTLTAIKTGKSFCRPKMLDEILQLINDIQVDVHLVWVPSHLGIEGNEKADRLAQNATNNKEVEENIYLEFSENNIRIKSFIINKWQYMWTNSQHGHFYRNIEPTVSWQIKYEHKNRNKEVTISRLRLGKCCVNEYLAMMKVVESDKCPECSTAVETVEHFLLQCPKSDLCKDVLTACAQLKITPNIENILTNVKIIDVIFRNISRKI